MSLKQWTWEMLLKKHLPLRNPSPCTKGHNYIQHSALTKKPLSSPIFRHPKIPRSFSLSYLKSYSPMPFSPPFCSLYYSLFYKSSHIITFQNYTKSVTNPFPPVFPPSSLLSPSPLSLSVSLPSFSLSLSLLSSLSPLQHGPFLITLLQAVKYQSVWMPKRLHFIQEPIIPNPRWRWAMWPQSSACASAPRKNASVH